MTTRTPTSRRLTRYLAGPSLALGLALGSAAVATAEREWDIGGYDQCMSHYPGDEFEDTVEWTRLCCVNSGGVWTGARCVAPPAEQSGRNSLPSDAPTHVMQPAPLPGPGGDIGPAPGGRSE